MFRRIDDFVTIWTEELKKTRDVLARVPASSLRTPGLPHRDLGRLGWHLLETCVELPSHLGLTVPGPKIANGFIAEAIPEDPAAIDAAYAVSATALAELVKGWNDAELEVGVEMYGESWTKGYALFALVVHQAHHRGQMALLLRQAGVQPTDVYGPTQEGWAKYGLEAPAV